MGHANTTFMISADEFTEKQLKQISSVGLSTTSAMCIQQMTGMSLLFTAMVWLGVLVCTIEGWRQLPSYRQKISKIRAAGRAPALVSALAFELAHTPNLERAIDRTRVYGNDALSTSLRSHSDTHRAMPAAGIESFIEEWEDTFRPLSRALRLLNEAVETPSGRDSALERAVAVAVQGVENHLQQFAAEIRGPVSGLYAIGVLVPLALVGVIPAARAGGVVIPTAVFLCIYIVALPIGVTSASGWVLLQRPLALAPTRLDDAVERNDGIGICIGVVVGVAGWVISKQILPWAAPLALVALGGGTAVSVSIYPRAKRRRKVAQLESTLGDSLSMLGRRVEAGQPVETGVEYLCEATQQPLRDIWRSVHQRQTHVGASITDALAYTYQYQSYPSQDLSTAFALVGLAGRSGPPAGVMLRRFGTHLTTIQEGIERAERDLQHITGTLMHTATVFAPLVGGATVAMATSIHTSDAIQGAPLRTDILGLVIGGYVCWLAVLLTALATGLTRGLDRDRVGYRCSIAVITAFTCYVTAFFAGQRLL
jgi:hypothetical protein